MDIQDMKRAAKAASRAAGTSHQAELNRIARDQGYTHWGALAAAHLAGERTVVDAESRSHRTLDATIGLTWSHIDDTNADDLQDARNRRAHIVYASKDRRMSIAHLIAMASTIEKLPHERKERIPSRIEAPDETVILKGSYPIANDWMARRIVSEDEMSTLTPGTLLLVEHLRPKHLVAADGMGLRIVGVAAPRSINTWWPAEVRDKIVAFFDPEPAYVPIETGQGHDMAVEVQSLRREVMRQDGRVMPTA